MAGHDEVTGGWHKSSSSGADCVEVRIAAEHVQVRDTKNPHETVLTFSHQEWRAFLTGVRRREFELPE
jgi:Domain of unknown function (DUF397)